MLRPVHDGEDTIRQNDQQTNKLHHIKKNAPVPYLFHNPSSVMDNWVPFTWIGMLPVFLNTSKLCSVKQSKTSGYILCD